MKKLLFYFLMFMISIAISSCEKRMDFNDSKMDSRPMYSTTSVVESPECTEETAWAAGPRYVARGNWATFTPLSTEVDPLIFAGQNMLAGKVTFSAWYEGAAWNEGEIRIKIWLDPCWSLQDVVEPIKIQGYSKVPSGNPSPGLFTTYKGIGEIGQWGYIYVIVPMYDYYGIHLDLQNCCE